MDQKFIDKYFTGQCSDKELIQLFTWFQTREGRSFLKHHIYRDWCLLEIIGDLFPDHDIPTEKIFNRIQQTKQTSSSNDTKT